MNNKILILGGSSFQVPLIKYCLEQGDYVITCDYLPENPGHILAHEYHNISTTDIKNVFELAKIKKIDAIMSFGSEPALQTIAYVAENLGLSGTRLDTVMKLTDKYLFRETQLLLGLPTPKNYLVESSANINEIFKKINNLKLGNILVVKPVDSSGSKGVSIINNNLTDINNALIYAFSKSRNNRCIIEEYIEADQVHGDGYVKDGKLIFHYLGDHIFYEKSGSRIPISTIWPTKYKDSIINNLVKQIESICDYSGYNKGSLNIEARITPGGKIYLIELSPRNAGYHVPILIEHLTGFDFIKTTYSDSLSTTNKMDSSNISKKIGSMYVLHPTGRGALDKINISSRVKKNIVMLEIFKKIGTEFQEFKGSGDSIGVVLMKFSSNKEQKEIMDNIDKHLNVSLT